jgi:carboxylesterase
MIHVDQERDRVAALTAAFFGEDAPYAVESLEMRSHV